MIRYSNWTLPTGLYGLEVPKRYVDGNRHVTRFSALSRVLSCN